MKCPNCHGDKLNVINSRKRGKNNSIMRRRVCDRCESRYTTNEYILTEEKTEIDRLKKKIEALNSRLERIKSIAMFGEWPTT